MTSTLSTRAVLWAAGVLAIASWAAPAQSQPYLPQAPPEVCESASGDAADWLDRTAGALGLDRPGILHAHAVDVLHQPHQSDRPYPPFYAVVQNRLTWFDPATGVERDSSDILVPGVGPNPVPTMLRGPNALQMARGERRQPIPVEFGPRRELNAWAVVSDWQAASTTGSVNVAAECVYRDFPRVVLEREGPYGSERLYLDPETALPVKLDRIEAGVFWDPHAVWGQARAEVVYSVWQAIDGRLVPGSTSRTLDGLLMTSRTMGAMEIVDPSDAPDLALDASLPTPPTPVEPTPDTVRVSDDVYLLSTRTYTEVVVRVDDTVYVLDATTDETRARHVMDWVERLFPNADETVVVVTDVAWPHVGGVRSWVAEGATVVSHTTSEPFLRQLVGRRWTETPDRLEGRRNQASLDFVGVDGAMSLADSRVELATIGGIGSEGALAVYLPDAGFLWAGDYIQTTQAPSAYAQEVIATVGRQGWVPERTAAQHLPLTPWQTVVDVNR